MRICQCAIFVTDGWFWIYFGVCFFFTLLVQQSFLFSFYLEFSTFFFFVVCIFECLFGFFLYFIWFLFIFHMSQYLPLIYSYWSGNILLFRYETKGRKKKKKKHSNTQQHLCINRRKKIDIYIFVCQCFQWFFTVHRLQNQISYFFERKKKTLFTYLYSNHPFCSLMPVLYMFLLCRFSRVCLCVYGIFISICFSYTGIQHTVTDVSYMMIWCDYILSATLTSCFVPNVCAGALYTCTAAVYYWHFGSGFCYCLLVDAVVKTMTMIVIIILQ